MSAPEPRPAVPRALPRAVTILVVVSVAVNVVIAVIVAVSIGYLIDLGHQNAVNTARNAQNAARIHASQIESCRASNTARHRDIAIWNRLLSITPAQKAAETPAQQAAAQVEIAQLRHLVALKDTPVKCAVLYRN